MAQNTGAAGAAPRFARQPTPQENFSNYGAEFNRARAFAELPPAPAEPQLRLRMGHLANMSNNENNNNSNNNENYGNVNAEGVVKTYPLNVNLTNVNLYKEDPILLLESRIQSKRRMREIEKKKPVLNQKKINEIDAELARLRKKLQRAKIAQPVTWWNPNLNVGVGNRNLHELPPPSPLQPGLARRLFQEEAAPVAAVEQRGLKRVFNNTNVIPPLPNVMNNNNSNFEESAPPPAKKDRPAGPNQRRERKSRRNKKSSNKKTRKA